MINALLVFVLWWVAFAQMERGLAQPVESAVSFIDQRNCPAYTRSEYYRARRNIINIDISDDWVFKVESAPPGSEILFADGTYELDQELVKIGSDVTLRSAGGVRDNVVIQGVGYWRSSQGLVIAGDRVTIADLSITGLRDHGIFVKPELGGGASPHIYNVHVYDIGTQHVKSNASSAQGVIACSLIGYTENGAVGDYNGAIDLHGATAWHIRDNEIYNISGDGSGCNVKRECGRYISSPAILVWNQSSDTLVERNYIHGSFRNIAFGLGRGHQGGVIRHNTIIRNTRGDAGIELQSARGTLVENNTVLLYDRYRGAIEYRDSANLIVRANRVSSLPWNRGNNVNVVAHGNKVVRVPRPVRRPVGGCSKAAV